MITTLHGDCREILRTLPDASVQCCVTSPPYYGLRRYSDDSREIGQEATPALYVAALVEVFREVKRVLRDDGVLWLNLGDSYVANRGNSAEKPGFDNKAAGGKADLAIRDYKIPGKEKDLLGIPWRVAFALQDDGWYLRSDIIWHKPNCMPESVTDRPTRSHEYVFLLSKSARYFYDAAAIAEDAIKGDAGAGARNYRAGTNGNERKHVGQTDKDRTTRNRRTVWTIPTQPYSGAHYATMPEALIAPCILAGSAAGDTVLDPFGGSGTVGKVALRYQRNAVLIELNAAYIDEHIESRTDKVQIEMFV